jgi:hypothetical protein
MKKSKPAKMQEKEAKMKKKENKLLKQLTGVATKVATATAMLALMLLAGCQDTNPASRSNEAGYGDFEPSVVINGSSNSVTVRVAVGDGVYAKADGGGDSQATTPTQTTDVKPDIKAAVGAGATASGAAGNNPEMITGFISMVSGWLSANKGVNLSETEKASLSAACADGSCAPSSK